MERTRVGSDAPWEREVGYCRAIRVGNRIAVTGTVAVEPDGSVHAPGDAHRQTARCLEIIERALEGLGAELRHVFRTRMFVTDISRWPEIGEAHGDRFRDFPPATTMVEVSALIAPEFLVEIEADAIVDEG